MPHIMATLPSTPIIAWTREDGQLLAERVLIPLQERVQVHAKEQGAHDVALALVLTEFAGINALHEFSEQNEWFAPLVASVLVNDPGPGLLPPVPGEELSADDGKTAGQGLAVVLLARAQRPVEEWIASYPGLRTQEQWFQGMIEGVLETLKKSLWRGLQGVCADELHVDVGGEEEEEEAPVERQVTMDGRGVVRSLQVSLISNTTPQAGVAEWVGKSRALQRLDADPNFR